MKIPENVNKGIEKLIKTRGRGKLPPFMTFWAVKSTFKISYLYKVTRIMMQSAMKQACIFFRHCFSVESRFDIHLTFLIQQYAPFCILAYLINIFNMINIFNIIEHRYQMSP